eukprot:3886748-Amphidinium_carterae.1
MKATKLQKERCPWEIPAVPGLFFSGVREKQRVFSSKVTVWIRFYQAYYLGNHHFLPVLISPRGPPRPQTHDFCSSDWSWGFP